LEYTIYICLGTSPLALVTLGVRGRKRVQVFARIARDARLVFFLRKFEFETGPTGNLTGRPEPEQATNGQHAAAVKPTSLLLLRVGGLIAAACWPLVAVVAVVAALLLLHMLPCLLC
jgi:hypothetical protein